jgi:hypothetical protein
MRTGVSSLEAVERTRTHRPALAGGVYLDWLEGSFVDYGADKIRRLGSDLVEQKRIRYLKFAR